MRILQIAPCYIDIYSETGGVANIVRQICLNLAKNKIETILICPNTELGKKVSQERTVEFSTYLTIHIIMQHKNPLLGPIKNLRKILETLQDISLVHIHTCFSAFTDYSLKYFLNKKTPIVFTPHGKLSPSMYSNKKIFKKVYYNLFLKSNLNKINSFVASSTNEIDYAKNLGINGNFSYIYNGYNDSELNSSENNYWELKEKSFLLFLGYLDPRKQPDLLIKAFARSSAKQKYKLVLAGPDAYGYKSKLEKLIKKIGLKIGKEIIFTGRVQGIAKSFLLRNAKALILPSKGEGWPVVIAEAIGAKTPLIISRECNFSEINDMKLGIEVPDFDVNNWTTAINEICFNKELYDSFEQGLNKYHIYFSWDHITNQWKSKYLSIINEARIKQN